MNKLTSKWIVMDTNVFEHLVNPKENICNHIYKLLERFLTDNILFLVDDEKQITREYSKRLPKYFKKLNEGKGERLLLKRLFDSHKKVVSVNLSDKLMTCITKIVPKNKGVDRFFVYVAFKKGKILVTNNTKDMIDDGKRTGEKRKELIKCLSHKNRSANILTSWNAYNRL